MPTYDGVGILRQCVRYLAFIAAMRPYADNALVATANFLKSHGWRPNAGYQPGEPNFAAIQAWNAATVYQRAIALMGRQIDSGGVANLD